MELSCRPAHLHPKKTSVLTTRSLLASTLLALSLPALGDISYSQKITVDASGGMSMLSSEANIVTQLSGDRSRTDSTLEMESSIASLAMGSGNSANIVRLDRELTWTLDPDKQQYSEITFAQARADLQKALDAMNQSSESALPVSEDSCRWSKPDIEVEGPGDREKIAGIKTRKHVIRMRQSCTDPDSGKKCDMTWVMESWLAKKVPAEKEVLRFRDQYARAMGLDEAGLPQGNTAGQALINMFGDNWESVTDEIADIDGYPLRTVMQMGMGGEQCTTASGNPIATDEMWADASRSAYNAALDQAGYEAGSAIGQAAGESLGSSAAGKIGGAAVGAAASELIGGLSGMFKKKKPSKKEKEQQAPASAGNQQVTLFRITTEVTEWSEISIPAERFEEPTGWKKL